MNVLWIIGNGFDLNLGLKTGYRDFYERCYSTAPEAEAARGRLLSEFPRGTVEGISRWSDLELLLGEASGRFAPSEVEDFHETFEQMQSLFTGYLAQAQRGFLRRSLPQPILDEFAASALGFYERLIPPNRNRMEGLLGGGDGEVVCRFASLNYTSALDHVLGEASQRPEALTSAMPGPGEGRPRRVEGGVLHVHGTVEGGDVVFGVSDPSQVAGPEFSQDDEFLELWVKGRKNDFYGNRNNERLANLLEWADAVCVYGSSLGETDAYIWRRLCLRLKADKDMRLVVFDHAAPVMQPPLGRRLQVAKNDVVQRLVDVGAWDQKSAQFARDRVLVQSSRSVFDFDAARYAFAGR